jgi:hypothetical protein
MMQEEDFRQHPDSDVAGRRQNRFKTLQATLAGLERTRSVSLSAR